MLASPCADSRTSFDVKGRHASGDSDNYHLGLYGGANWEALALRTGAAYTWHDVSTRRTVGFPGFGDIHPLHLHRHSQIPCGNLPCHSIGLQQVAPDAINQLVSTQRNEGQQNQHVNHGTAHHTLAGCSHF